MKPISIIMLLSLLAPSGWLWGVSMCLHDNGSGHVMSSTSLIAETHCGQHDCDDNAGQEAHCLETKNCNDVFIGVALPLAKSSSARELIEIASAVGRLNWDHAGKVKVSMTHQVTFPPRAPPAQLSGVHIAIASTVLII